MFEDRSVKLDLFALALLVATVFLGLSLFTFNPADPVGEVGPPLSSVYQPDTTVYPQLEQASNACGRWGALAADMLLQGFGLGAYYLVFSLGVLDFLLLRRFEIDSPVLRTVGWVASLLGVVALASMIFPNASPGPVVGSGGYTGALAATMVRAHFAAVGGFVLCFSLVVGGLMLCT
ncbi:MAG: DNA translocase FtsK 4TM domain-containing protein, partial [Pirellulaceae bacterium]|nr:DNA translocase FtsK 4TM domain-containing protein [Pirellulaceae bacterium]